MPAYPQHFSSRSACICRRKLLLPQYSLAELCLFIAVDWEWCSDPGKTTGFWEPGHQPATPGQLSPMKPVLEAHKPSQNAVIASTAQVDQVASECACGLKPNSQWKYLSSSLNLHWASMVLFRIQQGVHSPKCWCCHELKPISLVLLPSLSSLHFLWLQSKSWSREVSLEAAPAASEAVIPFLTDHILCSLLKEDLPAALKQLECFALWSLALAVKPCSAGPFSELLPWLLSVQDL